MPLSSASSSNGSSSIALEVPGSGCRGNDVYWLIHDSNLARTRLLGLSLDSDVYLFNSTDDGGDISISEHYEIKVSKSLADLITIFES